MKICSNCGKECNDEIKFCMFCGNPFPAAEDVITPEEPAAEEYTEPSQVQEYHQENQQQYQQQSTEQKYEYRQQNSEQQYQQQNAGTQYEQYGGQQYGAAPRYGQYAAQPQTGATNGFAIAALILGIIGITFVLNILLIPSILAIIFGAVGLGKAKKTGTGRGMSIAGLVLGIISLAIVIIGIAILSAGIMYGLGSLGLSF